METDTIAAIASGVAQAGITVIRTSGPKALQIADRIFYKGNAEFYLQKCESHTIHYGFIKDEDETIDEVMVMIMKAPKSYTTEDIVEIDCHGGSIAARRILELLIRNGARLAEPGEFTKRAFLNGRIDLTKAEAVMDLIESTSAMAMKNSVSQLKGNIYNKIKELRDIIIMDIAYIEAALDDPEHMSLDGYSETINSNIVKCMNELKKIYDKSDHGRLVKEGIKTVILGKPNAGKSTLLNTMTGEDKAIVTEIEGTTRDLLEEHIMIRGIQLNIIDTAGIRKTEDVVEKIGVERAMIAAKDADLIIYVVDLSKQLDENDEEILSFIRDRKAIILLNKADTSHSFEIEELKNRTDKAFFYISAKEQTGIEQLESEIERLFFQGEINFNDQVYITNLRQKEAVLEAIEALKLVKKSIDDGLPEDFYSIDLVKAYEVLGSIIGESVDEEIINTIFAKFCLGK